MKRLLIAVVLVLMTVGGGSAEMKTFLWDANTESDLAGYRLYRSDTSGQYTIGEGWVANIPAGTDENRSLPIEKPLETQRRSESIQPAARGMSISFMASHHSRKSRRQQRSGN